MLQFSTLDHMIREQKDLVDAMEFLVDALIPGPVCYSALNVGWLRRGIPLWSIHAAKTKLGIEACHDVYGIALWRLPEEKPAPEKPHVTEAVEKAKALLEGKWTCQEVTLNTPESF